MAATGVSVDDGAISEYTEFKKQSNTTRYIIFNITNGKIVLEQKSEDGDFENFLNQLPENDCRYALYKTDFTTSDGRPGTKLVSVSWSPDSANVKSKMVYAGSKDALTRVLVGIAIKVTATDRSELTLDILQDACRKFN